MPSMYCPGINGLKVSPLGHFRQRTKREAKRSASSPGLQVNAKGKGGGRRAGKSQRPGGQPSMEQFMPPVDPDNEQFVIYVRSKKGMRAWYPLNVVTGGSTANTLVKGLDSNLSRDMAKKSLTNNIGQAIYKDADQLQEMCRRMPMLKAAQELEYGFMILDKKNPSSMFKPPADKVFIIPPEEETQMPAQKMTEGLQSAANAVKSILGNNSPSD
mmetsp:Transcript_11207/g.50860  ORF Transcript_11207/g.50860 Transcript_11207/m.50860 type:complete len:214 (-) Transcript_11207:1528-2169(-)